MTVLGNTSNPTSGGNDTADYTQIAPASNALTTPVGLVVTKLWAYFGGTSGSISGAKICIWTTGGTLLYASDAITVPSGKAWRSVVPSTPPILASGVNLYVGFWVPSGSNVTFGIRSSGNWQAKNVGGSPGSMSGSSEPGSPYVQGEPGGYLEYVPAGVYFGVGDGTPTAMNTIYSGASDGTPTTITAIYVGAADGTPVQIR